VKAGQVAWQKLSHHVLLGHSLHLCPPDRRHTAARGQQRAHAGGAVRRDDQSTDHPAVRPRLPRMRAAAAAVALGRSHARLPG